MLNLNNLTENQVQGHNVNEVRIDVSNVSQHRKC